MGDRNASKAPACRKKVDEHLTTQVRVNAPWKARDKKDGEMTRAQWEDLLPQPREWLDERNPTKQVSTQPILHLFWHTQGIWGKSWR